MLTIVLVGYVVIAVLVTLIVAAVDDPYSHFPAWMDWAQAVFVGVLWLPCVFYVAGTIVWHWWKGDL